MYAPCLFKQNRINKEVFFFDTAVIEENTGNSGKHIHTEGEKEFNDRAREEVYEQRREKAGMRKDGSRQGLVLQYLLRQKVVVVVVLVVVVILVVVVVVVLVVVVVVLVVEVLVVTVVVLEMEGVKKNEVVNITK